MLEEEGGILAQLASKNISAGLGHPRKCAASCGRCSTGANAGEPIRPTLAILNLLSHGKSSQAKDHN